MAAKIDKEVILIPVLPRIIIKKSETTMLNPRDIIKISKAEK